MTTTTTGQSGSRGRPRGSGRPLCEKWSEHSKSSSRSTTRSRSTTPPPQNKNHSTTPPPQNNQNNNPPVNLQPRSHTQLAKKIPAPNSRPPPIPLILNRENKRPPAPRSISPLPPIKRPKVCSGINSGNFGAILTFAAQSFKHTAVTLLGWASESDGGLASYMASALSKSKNIILPYRHMILRKAPSNNGYSVYDENCTTVPTTGKRGRCDACHDSTRSGKTQIYNMHRPNFTPFGDKSRIDYIASDHKQGDVWGRRRGFSGGLQ